MGEFTLREMSMNVVHVVRGAVKGALVARTGASSRRLLARLLRDEEGSNLVLFAALLPVLVGIAGLGTEGGLWLYTQQALQGATDSAAVAAARAYSINTSANTLLQAEAMTGGYGYVNGTNGVTVTVNHPPKSGNYTTNQDAIEVIVTQPQSPLFSSLWFSKSFNIAARSVALAPQPCGVLALDPTASGAVLLALGARVNLTGCPLFSDSDSNSSIELFFFAEITATGNGGTVGTVGNVLDIFGSISPTASTGDNAISDPYAGISTPVPTAQGPYTVPKLTPCTTVAAVARRQTKSLGPGTYCGPGGVNSAVTVSGGTLNTTGGTYIFTDGITASSGTVNLGAGTYTSNGPITVSGGAVTLGSGTYTVQGGASQAITVTGGTITVNPGTYTLYGNTKGSTTEGGIDVSGGTFTSNPGTYTMTMTGGTCVGGTGATCSSGSSGTLSFGSGTYTMSQLTETNGSTVTLNGGTNGGAYILNSDSTTTPMLSLNGSTLTGTGATVVFTTSTGQYDTSAMTVTSSTINLTAPTTATTYGIPGIAMFANNSTSGSNAMPVGTSFTFDAVSALNVTGAVYLPRGYATFAGIAGSTANCTLLIADKIQFIFIAGLQDECSGVGTFSIGSPGAVALVE
jgi:hypothetical protein